MEHINPDIITSLNIKIVEDIMGDTKGVHEPLAVLLSLKRTLAK